MNYRLIPNCRKKNNVSIFVSHLNKR